MTTTGNFTLEVQVTEAGTYYNVTPNKGKNAYYIRFSATHGNVGAGQWEMMTHRTNYSQFAGAVHFFDTIADLEASRKCLRGLNDAIMALFF